MLNKKYKKNGKLNRLLLSENKIDNENKKVKKVVKLQLSKSILLLCSYFHYHFFEFVTRNSSFVASPCAVVVNCT